MVDVYFKVDLDYGVPWFGLDASPEQQREQREAQKREMLAAERRMSAIRNLWRQAAREVTVRHPDPKVSVVLEVERAVFSSGTNIHFRIHDVCDTGDADRRFATFSHGAAMTSWPGYEPAKMYLAAAWALYLQHEAFELVNEAEKTPCDHHKAIGRGFVGACPMCCERVAIINAHGAGKHQMMVARDMYNVQAMLGWALGNDEAAVIVESNAARAQIEIANEVAYLEAPWDR